MGHSEVLCLLVSGDYSVMFSVRGPSGGVTLFPHSGVLDKLLRTSFPGMILIHSCAHKILVYFDKCIE